MNSLAALCLVTICVQFGQIEDLTPRQIKSILKESNERFEKRHPIHYEFESTYSLVGGPESEVASFGSRREGEVRYDGKRVETFHANERWEKKTKSYRPSTKEHSVSYRDRSIGLRTFLDRGHEQAFTIKAKLHDEIRPDMSGWFLDGVVVGSDHYTELLLQASDLEGNTETLDDGALYFRIHGNTPKGPMTAWFTTTKPTLTRRVQFGTNWEYASELNGLDRATIDMSVSTYREIAGVIVPTEGTIVTTYFSSGQEEAADKQIVSRRMNISLKPDFKAMGAFEFTLEEDTNVANYDDPEERYIWKNGALTAAPKAPQRAPTLTASARRKPLSERYVDLDWWKPFVEAYAPNTDNAVRLIPQPRPDSGSSLLRELQSDRPGMVSFIHWDSGTMVNLGMRVSTTGPGDCTVVELLTSLLGENLSSFRFPDDLNSVLVVGDWSVERDATTEEKIASFQNVLQNLGHDITFKSVTENRTVIMVEGTPTYNPLPKRPNGEGLYLYGDEFGGAPVTKMHGNNLGKITEALENYTRVPVVDDTTNLSAIKRTSIVVVMESAEMEKGEAETEAGAKKLDLILENLSLQTSLKLQREKRTLKYWDISYKKE
jgi:hypothetical protein